MALKFLLVVLLMVAGINAAPAIDEDESEMDDDLLDTEAASEDEIDEDEAEDDEDADEAKSTTSQASKKAKSTTSKTSEKKKFHELMGKNAYCVCKVASKPKRDANEVADEPMSDQELSDQLNEKLAVLDASSKSKKAALAAYEKKLHDLIKRYFGQRNLYCYCTKNKMVLKLIRLLHSLKWFGNKTASIAIAAHNVAAAIKKSQA